MTPEDWKQIKHFSPNENWGDPSKIKLELLTELDRFREHLGKPIIVTCGTQGKHVKNSLHNYGLAVDVMFPWASKRDLLDVLLIALRFDFYGVGVYGDWKHRGQEIGGLHLDRRIASFRALWVGDIDQTTKQRVYRPFNRISLAGIGLI